ncbi:hypothetical protein GEMRC1_013057 [Eukaryota sp. GEM-RC1]
MSDFEQQLAQFRKHLDKVKAIHGPSPIPESPRILPLRPPPRPSNGLPELASSNNDSPFLVSPKSQSLTTSSPSTQQLLIQNNELRTELNHYKSILNKSPRINDSEVISKLKEKLSSEMSENAFLYDKVKKLEDYKTSTESQLLLLSSLQHSVSAESSLTKQLELTQNQLKHYKVLVDKLSKEKEDLSQSNVLLTCQLSETSHEVKRVQKLAENSTSDLCNQINDLKREVLLKTEEIGSLNSKILSLYTQINTSTDSPEPPAMSPTEEVTSSPCHVTKSFATSPLPSSSTLDSPFIKTSTRSAPILVDFAVQVNTVDVLREVDNPVFGKLHILKANVIY